MTTINGITISGKTNYIILANNTINGTNIGSNLYIDARIIDNQKDNDASLNEFFSNKYPNKYKNRIILSQTSVSSNNNKYCFITKNNIKNNIKFIYDSNKKNGKILFVKNQNINDNSNNYLFENIANTNINGQIIDLNLDLNDKKMKYLFHLNYYFNNDLSNTDYYKINLKDYLYKYRADLSNALINNTDLCYNLLKYKITDFSSTNNFLNITSQQSIINYKSSDFSSLFIDSSTNNTNIKKLVIDTSYSIYQNIYSYNKLTLDFKNENNYTFTIDYSGNNVALTNKINTFLIKTNNFSILNTIKNNSKIIFDANNIYLKNVKVLDYSSNFYYNNSNLKKTDASKNTIFLSLGNQITGFTQYDLYNHTYINTNSNTNSNTNIQKIIFSKNINNSQINSISNNPKYKELAVKKDNFYLLDFSFNYNSNSNNINSNNINNTINFNNVLYNYIQYKTSKIFDLNFDKFIDFSNSKYNNYFNNSFNSIELLNNKTNYFSNYIGNVNNGLNIDIKDISYNTEYKLNNRTLLSDNIFLLNSKQTYDLRFNYDSIFYVNLTFDILLNNSLFELSNNYPFSNLYSYSLLNFYSLQIANLISTTAGSDFDNVGCIFIYHDPITDPSANFRYPNNNIEIIRNPTIDTLAKAIVVLPGARTSTTNSVFIPDKNGSNLSRKMIQGLIGLDNIPKLLSIKPFDPNFIDGRGFINQFQINNTCPSDLEQIKLKINANKHDSVKDLRTFTTNTLNKQNFANLVQSNARNRLSQTCINNLRNATETLTSENYANIQVRTPFTLFRTGKGKYLGPN